MGPKESNQTKHRFYCMHVQRRKLCKCDNYQTLIFPAVLTPPNASIDDLNSSLKTPERIEFENTIEGLPEETEEEQWEQNLRASMSADSIYGDDDQDEDWSDSDLE